MRPLDRLLQRWRERRAWKWIPKGAAVLDVGCFQGEFLERLRDHISSGVGMDLLALPIDRDGIRLLPVSFQAPTPFASESFDAIIMLATLEHIEAKEAIPQECWRLLRPGGRVIVTVPSPAVDAILAVLMWLRLLDGMSASQHHGFAPGDTRELFGKCGFALEHDSRFQLGLNNLFVFRKKTAWPAAVPANP
jgi:2-polyprenyl-3-methyl-5-hydroxy-6-metoxy-1,4-benzoquinol methylase